jgi:TonB family protein
MTLEILVNTTLRLLLIGAVAWLVLRLVRVRNPHVEALVWRMLLLAGLALPLLLALRLAPRFITPFALPEVVVGAGGADPPADAGVAWVPPVRVLVPIYLGVALLLLARLAIGLTAMGRVCRAATVLELHGDVRISTQVRSPATFGAIILLPAEWQSWPAQKRDAVLAHERAHVRSRDGYWSWLARAHAAIFWFNPLAWWLQRRLDTLAETTSDDAVVRARHDPVGYAALLLDFARHPNSRSVVMSVAESNVPERIERLLARTPPSTALPRAVRWTAFTALVPVVLFAAATSRAAPSSEPASHAPPAAQAPPPHALPRVSAKINRSPHPQDYYPALAKAQKVSGAVVVRVDVDALGQFVDARVLDVQPADPQFGFADAALRIARDARYSTPNQQPSSVTFRVKFESKEEPRKEPKN